VGLAIKAISQPATLGITRFLKMNSKKDLTIQYRIGKVPGNNHHHAGRQ
jgi:hypothetical protein